MYWGHSGAYYVKLNQDMLSYSGSLNNVLVQSFIEGHWLYKRNSTLYLSYAGSGGGDEDIRYVISSKPTGSWNYMGQIMASQSR